MSGSSRGGFGITISAVDNATKTIDHINHSLEKMKAPAVALEKSFGKLAETTGIVALKEGFEHVAESSGRAFENIGRIVAPLEIITGAASLAGLSRLVTGFATMGAGLSRAGERSRISAGDLAAFQGAATLAGDSAEAMGAGVKSLNDNMFHAAQGTAPDAITAFEKLNLTFADWNPKLNSVKDLLPKVVAELSKIKDPSARNQIAMMLFGGAADGLFKTLSGGRKAFEAYIEAAKKSGSMTDEQARAALELDHAQRRLEASVTGLANAISAGLARVLPPLLDWMAKWIDDNREVIGQDVAGWAKNVATWIKAAAPEVQAFAHSANAVAQALGGWKTILEGIAVIVLGGWALRMVAALNPLTLALAAILETIYKVQTFEERNAPQNLPAGSPFWKDVSPEEQGNYLNSPRSQEFWNKYHPPAFSPMEPNTWIPGLRRMFGAASQEKMPPASGTERAATAKLVHDQFRAAGYTEEQTAGVLANVNAESGFDSNAIGDNGTSLGLYQHHAERRAELLRRYGSHPTAQQATQLTLDELKPGGAREAAGIHLRAARSATEAGEVFSKEFESPADAEGEARRRGHSAAPYVGLYDENPAGAPAANVGGGSGTTPAAPQTTTVKGSADLRVRISADPGLTAKTTATTSGDLFSGAPNIGPAMGVP